MPKIVKPEDKKVPVSVKTKYLIEATGPDLNLQGIDEYLEYLKQKVDKQGIDIKEITKKWQDTATDLQRIKVKYQIND